MRWSELPVEERLRLKFLMETSEEKRAEVTLPEVVVPGHAIEADFLPKQPREVYHLLQAKRRQVSARHSQTRIEGTEFKSGPRKGERRPDKVIDHYSIATTDKRLPVFYAVWSDGSLFLGPVRIRSYVDIYPRNVTELKQAVEEHHG